MPNSAQTLAQLLEGWDVDPGTAPESARGFDPEDRSGFWRQQAKALALVRDVDQILAGMDGAGEDVSMFLRLMPPLYEAVIGYTVPWQSTAQGRREVIPPGHLDLLRALGAIVDSHGALTISAPEQESLREALSDAESLVLEDQTLGVSGRRYIWQLIVEALNALDDIEQFGPGRVRAASFELAGAVSEQARVTAMQPADGEEKASRWRDVRDKLTGGFMNETGRTAAKQLGSLVKDGLEGLSG